MNRLQRRLCTLLGLGDLVAHLDALVTESAWRELEWWRAGQDVAPPEDRAPIASQAMLAPNVSRETMLSRAVARFMR